MRIRILNSFATIRNKILLRKKFQQWIQNNKGLQEMNEKSDELFEKFNARRV